MAPKSLPRALGMEAVATFPLSLLFRLKTKPEKNVCIKMAAHKYSLLLTLHFYTGTETPQGRSLPSPPSPALTLGRTEQWEECGS